MPSWLVTILLLWATSSFTAAFVFLIKDVEIDRTERRIATVFMPFYVVLTVLLFLFDVAVGLIFRRKGRAKVLH